MFVIVDLHSHILPGVDDGADSISEAFDMLEIAVANGTKHIALTPHHLLSSPSNALQHKEMLYNQYCDFKKKAEERFPSLTFYFGAENLVSNNINDILSADGIITLNNTCYALIEFNFDYDFLLSLRNVEALLNAGYKPVLAHPERFLFIQENPERIAEYLQLGVLLQLNSTSIFGESGELAAELTYDFLDNHLIASVSSDCHSSFFRTPDLSKAYLSVASNFGTEYAEEIFYKSPLSILNDEEI